MNPTAETATGTSQGARRGGRLGRRLATVPVVALLLTGSALVGTASAQGRGGAHDQASAHGQGSLHGQDGQDGIHGRGGEGPANGVGNSNGHDRGRGMGPPVTLACGQTITHSTVLFADVGPCTGDGLIVGSDNVTLNLHGHRVFGASPDSTGAGVYLLGRHGVKVINGTVTNFAGGVVIEGGAGNSVMHVMAKDNFGGSWSPYGDGILMESSSDNRIMGNQAIHNGPFSGIGIVSDIDSDHPRATAGTSTGNQILGNTVVDNNVGRSARLDDNDGIRVEPDSPGNVINRNQVRGSGLDGISLFRASGNSVITGNLVTGNGFDNQVGRHGDGIILFNLADHNQVQRNVAIGNAANGIQVRGPVRTTAGSTDNTITSNTAVGNSQLPAIPSSVFGATFDLKDANPNCDSNQWFGNRYGTAYPACTTTGGHQLR